MRPNFTMMAVTLLVSLLVFGGVGFYFGSLYTKNHPSMNTVVSETTATPTTISSLIPTSSTISTPTLAPTADQTANWKTYTNSKYMYSIEYPANYHFSEVANTSGDPGANLTVWFGSASPLTASNAITVGSFDTYVPSYGLREPDGMEPVSTADATVGGLSAKKYVDSSGQIVYVVIANGHRFEISSENTPAATASVFTQMVATIKFQ
jgi:hypothetical protein